jgi:hypothetical protein
MYRQASSAPVTVDDLRSMQVVAVRVHHLGPGRGEILDEFLLGVGLPVDFGERAKLRVRAEDQVEPGRGPLRCLGLAVAAFVDAVVISGPVSFSNAARSTRASSGCMNCGFLLM